MKRGYERKKDRESRQNDEALKGEYNSNIKHTHRFIE